MTTPIPPDATPTHLTARLAAALASEHLPLHGPFVIHLCRRVVGALVDTDPAALARLIEAVEALREAMGELPGLKVEEPLHDYHAPDAAKVRALIRERFSK